MEQLLRLPQVRDRIGLSRSEIYRRVVIGEFPAPVHIGARAVAWDAAAVDAWIKARLAVGESAGRAKAA